MRKAGYRKLRTTVFSIILVKTGVIEIGRKSAWALGPDILGTGRMATC